MARAGLAAVVGLMALLPWAGRPAPAQTFDREQADWRARGPAGAASVPALSAYLAGRQPGLLGVPSPCGDGSCRDGDRNGGGLRILELEEEPPAEGEDDDDDDDTVPSTGVVGTAGPKPSDDCCRPSGRARTAGRPARAGRRDVRGESRRAKR